MDIAALHRLRQKDKAGLQQLLGALNGAKNALGLDGCGDWMIEGRRGEIRACSGTFSIYLQCHSVRAWNAAKKQLAFCRGSQDSDDEGVLTLDRLPTEAEAKIIRNYVGIHMTRPPPAKGFGSEQTPS
ncbi:hypothetical protein [Bradyrhizobium sp. SZCCHNR1075]|uniref:hypothetical protein n=1 Tax=Bradyrhizobium sp. SZCCHNR1075 TaxID=3057362 RepID=UPI0028E32B5C|nr:hypothetical protein [Bradyrhizobium sp. SZCCHNR1075]